MGESGGLQPEQATSIDEFVIALGQLKRRSGLTYRQLELRAAARGDVLPRSTLADVLAGKTRPRPELLAAFVRACGEEERTERWLAAWDGLAAPAATAPEEAPPSRSGPRTARTPRSRKWLLSCLAALSLVGATAWVVIASGEPEGSGRGAAASVSRSGEDRLPGGRVEIRPALAPRLCLTDGRAPGYEPLVAVQRPCADVAPQETLLEPVGEGEYRIRWYHPDHGKACLKALRGKPADGLLEPWEACEQSSRFLITPYGADGSRQFVLRVAGQGCVTVRGAGTAEGAAATMEPCRKKHGQVFVIEPAP
ncbi:helix-turn-helix domain-containing protein [Streptomyces spectabilis]|uniref:XRE family transcriptional regulator n=1 Tax=Streptomyces spectabilis TaxID=68270 RepID=A0A5P2XN70_STRST|nr:helix-turn-helix domain-containing protein [Streptomyces spectabilis]MBB5107465.1 hypothetical protein [Streptomyces spectabilis]MCI3900153.1 hypothetical protein [Streptomyces spectabilis]QEV64420.1 XRE family transcriptional regulator [Streptomyces spectabilis]